MNEIKKFWIRLILTVSLAVVVCAVSVFAAIPLRSGMQLEQTVQQNTSNTDSAEQEAIQVPESSASQEVQPSVSEQSGQPAPSSAPTVAPQPSEQPQPPSVPAVQSVEPPVTQPPVNGDLVCYLTFDDGPSDNTLRILEVLQRYNIKATFFVIGSGKLDYLANIHSAGHTVALHAASHYYPSLYASDAAYLADLQNISNIVEQRIGVKSNCVRFPGGSSNGVSKKYCLGIMSRLTAQLPQMGYAYFDWNIDSTDAARSLVSAEEIKNQVLSAAVKKHAAGQSICVLMHDSAQKTTTVEALPIIIEGIRSLGYRFAALDATSFGFHHNVNN